MRKSLVAIIAVAIIGTIGIYTRSHNSTAGLSSNASASPASSQTSSNAATTASNPPASTSSGSSSNTAVASAQTSAYKDGTYKGTAEDTAYGTVQVSVTVSGGQITNVNFLQMPSDLGHSQEVTAFSEPLLKQSTLQKQSAHIDFVSGATSTSEGYQQSLQSALDQAA